MSRVKLHAPSADSSSTLTISIFAMIITFFTNNLCRYASEYYAKYEMVRKKLKSVHFLSPAGLLRTGSWVLRLLQGEYYFNLNCLLKSLLMGIKEQRKAWLRDFIEKDSIATRDCLAALEASHADEKFHGKITEAIWRTLTQFPLHKMDSNAELLRDNLKAVIALQISLIHIQYTEFLPCMQKLPPRVSN